MKKTELKMNNKIYEEALASALKRVEDLEDRMLRISIPNKKGFYEKKPMKESATTGQLKYIRMLKGSVNEGMTKQEAGIEIDMLLQKKSGTDMKNCIIENVVEPKEVDTEDVGIDPEGLM